MNSIDITTVLSSFVGSGLGTTAIGILYHFCREYRKEKKEKVFNILVHIKRLEKYALECKRMIDANELVVMDGGASIGDYRNMNIVPPPITDIEKGINSATPKEITSFVFRIETLLTLIHDSTLDIDHPENVQSSNIMIALETFNNAIGYIGYIAWGEARDLRKKNNTQQHHLSDQFDNLEQTLKKCHDQFIYSNRT